MKYHKYQVQFESGFKAHMLADNAKKAVESLSGKGVKVVMVSASLKSPVIRWIVTSPSGVRSTVWTVKK